MSRSKLTMLLLLILSAMVGAEPTVDIETTEKGMGPGLKEKETAVIAYKVFLDNGEMVDSAGIREPFSFKVATKEVVPGLSQGVLGMKVGERRKLIIPPELAYGSKELDVIPPNSTLTFEVELLQIKGHKPVMDPNAPLKEKFENEEYLETRHANDIQKPAMFEFMIREFFTKPWRYEDGHLKLLNSSGKLFILLILAVIIAVIGDKRGRWSL